MRLLDRLERKLGKYAIHNLMMYIIGLNAFVYILELMQFNPRSLFQLWPGLVLQGQVWRLITFVFIPPMASPIFIFFVLYFYYMMGSALEQEWGAFKFNMYYLIGIIGTIAASFITKAPMVGTFLNLSLFFAFARLYPDFQIRLFLILPIKVKWLAWFNWAYFVYAILTQSLPFQISAIVAIMNYFLFFGKDVILRRKHSVKAMYRRSQYKSHFTKTDSYHKCQICGKTELDDPELEFRYCSKCDGHVEYCMEHIFEHDHVKKHLDK